VYTEEEDGQSVLGFWEDHVVVYYESIKRELKRRLIYEYRCDERLNTKTEKSSRLGDTGLAVNF